MFNTKERLLLLTLAAINFSHIVDFMIMMPLGPQLTRSFGIDPHQFGLLVSSYTFTAGVAGFLASLMIDRFDRKSALLLFFVGFVIGTLACSLAPSYEVLLLARAGTGCFGGVLSSVIMAIVGDSFPAEKRGSAMGILMGAFSAASVLGVPFSLFLANQFNWHAPFLFLVAVGVLLSIVIFTTFPTMRGHLKGPHHQNSPFDSLIHIWQSPIQKMGLFFLFLIIFGQFSVIPYLSQSMVANAGLSESQLPLIYMVGGAASMLSSPLIGRWADRFGKRKIFRIFVPLSIFPVLAITHLNVQPAALVLALAGLLFIFTGGRMIPAMAMLQGLVSPKYRGSYMSVVSSVQQISAAIASYIAGVIVIRDASGHLLNYQYVGYISAIFSLIALYVSRYFPAES